MFSYSQRRAELPGQRHGQKTTFKRQGQQNTFVFPVIFSTNHELAIFSTNYVRYQRTLQLVEKIKPKKHKANLEGASGALAVGTAGAEIRTGHLVFAVRTRHGFSDG